MRIRIKPNGLVSHGDGRFLAEVEMVEDAAPEFVGWLPKTVDGVPFATGARLSLLQWVAIGRGQWRVEGVEVETITLRRTGCLAPSYPEGEEYFVGVAMGAYGTGAAKVHEGQLWRDADAAADIARRLNAAVARQTGGGQ